MFCQWWSVTLKCTEINSSPHCFWSECWWGQKKGKLRQHPPIIVYRTSPYGRYIFFHHLLFFIFTYYNWVRIFFMCSGELRVGEHGWFISQVKSIEVTAKQTGTGFEGQNWNGVALFFCITSLCWSINLVWLPPVPIGSGDMIIGMRKHLDSGEC